MTMTTKRAPRTTPHPGTVTVHVVEPFLVFHDGEQRGGTLHGVPLDTAKHWQRHGWATIADDKAKARSHTEAETND